MREEGVKKDNNVGIWKSSVSKQVNCLMKLERLVEKEKTKSMERKREREMKGIISKQKRGDRHHSEGQ